MNKKTLSIFTDGGAIGNPGPAGVGFVVAETGRVVKRFAKRIGETTNNVAEYTAVIEALKWLKNNYRLAELSNFRIAFSLDSRLVVNQLNGIFKIKDYKMRNLIVKVRQLEREIGGNISYRHVPREKNKEADSLVKSALGR